MHNDTSSGISRPPAGTAGPIAGGIRWWLVCISIAVLGLAGCAGNAVETEGTERAESFERGASNLRDSDIIPVGDSPVRGAADAWVTVVIFADFRDPFCARLAATLDELREEYDDRRLRLVFKHHPRRPDGIAAKAARAAEAARAQGRFWEMHDALFDNPAALRGERPEEALFEIARSVGLDTERLRRDMAGDDVEARLRRDRRLAADLEVGDVPTVFVSGGRISGARPARVYRAAIDNVYQVLRHGVVEGQFEREEIYRQSVETLYDHTRSEASEKRPAAAPIAALPVGGDRPETRGVDEALIHVAVFASLDTDSSLELQRRLVAIAEENPAVRLVWFHLPGDGAADGAAGLAHRLLEAADSPEETRRVATWLADRADRWRTEPARLREFAADSGLEPVDEKIWNERLEADRELARSHEVFGTPTLFVNGIRFAGTPETETLERVVDEQLQRARRLADREQLSGLELYRRLVELNRDRRETESD